MPVIAKLWCAKCRHSIAIGERWLEINEPALVGMPLDEILERLKGMRNQLSCSQCGARAVFVYPPDTHSCTNTETLIHEIHKKVDSLPEVLEHLLIERNWFLGKESQIVFKMESQVRAGRNLSERQLSLLASIKARIDKRKEPKIVSGGGPGTGKKR